MQFFLLYVPALPPPPGWSKDLLYFFNSLNAYCVPGTYYASIIWKTAYEVKLLENKRFLMPHLRGEAPRSQWCSLQRGTAFRIELL